MPPLRSLGVAVSGKHVGFCIAETPQRLLDWWVVQEGAEDCVRLATMIINLHQHYTLSVAVFEDIDHPSCQLNEYSRDCIDSTVSQLGETIPSITTTTWGRVHHQYHVPPDAPFRWVINEIVQHYPSLAYRKPPPRKPWTKEHRDILLFKAVALSLAY